MDARIVLYPKQTEAQQSTARAVLLAGEGGGKSYALRACLVIRCYEYPGTSAALLHPDASVLRDEHVHGPGGILELTQQWQDEGFVTIRPGEAHFAHGSVLRWASLDRQADLRRVQELFKLDVLAVDDAHQARREVVEALARRARVQVLAAAPRPTASPWLVDHFALGHVITTAPEDLPAGLRRQRTETAATLPWFHRSPAVELLPEWTAPYLAEDEARRERLQRVLASPEEAARDRAECAADCLTFIDRWCRAPHQKALPSWGLPDLPLLLWPRQRAYVPWLLDRIDVGGEAAIPKSREWGATLISMTVFLWLWDFWPGFRAKLISRKEDLVDDVTTDSMFGMIRFQLSGLPDHLKPVQVSDAKRLRAGEYADHDMRLVRDSPTSGSIISGESTNADVTRGGRATVVFFDEFARVDPALAKSAWTGSVEAVGRLTVACSSRNGLGNKFAELCGPKGHLKPEQVFTCHWYDDPRRTPDWFKGLLIEEGGSYTVEERDQEYGESWTGTTGLTICTVPDSAVYDDAAFDLAKARKHWPTLWTMDFGSGPSWVVLTGFLVEYADLPVPRLWADCCKSWTATPVWQIADDIRAARSDYTGPSWVFGDPAGWNRESDQESWGTNLAGAGVPIERLDPWYNTEYAIDETIRDLRWYLSSGNLRIHQTRASIFRSALQSWRWKMPEGVPLELVEAITKKPMKDWPSHAGDTARYACGYARRSMRREDTKPAHEAVAQKLLAGAGRFRLRAAV